MSSLNLYLDEDSMSQSLVQGLRSRGMEVITALEEDMIMISDRKHLAHATELNRVLFSYNISDYHKIHTEFLENGTDHGGIILSPQQRFSIGGQLKRILRLNAEIDQEQMKNQIEFLSNW